MKKIGKETTGDVKADVGYIPANGKNIASSSVENNVGADKTGATTKQNLTIIVTSLFVMMLWGALFAVVKRGYKAFGIDTDFYPDLILFAGVRFIVSGAILSAFCISTKRTYLVKHPDKAKGTLLVALFAVVLHYTCTYIGLGLVEAGKTALLKQAAVVVFVGISFLFFKEDRFAWGKIVGAALGIASVLVLNFDSTKIDFGLGSALVLAAGLCTVINNVVFKKTLAYVDPVAVTGYSQFIGGAVLFAIGLIFGGKFGTITWQSVGIMAFIVAATVVSYGLWYSVVRKYSLSKLFIIKMTEPLFASVASMILFGTKLTWQHAAAFLLVAAAVTVSNIGFVTKKRKERADNVAPGATEFTVRNEESKINESNAD